MDFKVKDPKSEKKPCDEKKKKKLKDNVHEAVFRTLLDIQTK